MFEKIFDRICLVLATVLTVVLGMARFVILPYMNAHADVLRVYPVNDYVLGWITFVFTVCTICMIISMIPCDVINNLEITIRKK